VSKNGEISSTERLLNQIRGDSHLQTTPISNTSPYPPNRIKKRFLSKISPKKNGISIGVDIGHTDLKLVKMERGSEKRVELTGYSEIPFISGISIQHPGFPEFLKTAVASFCEDLSKVDLWCAMPSTNIELRYLCIPKVPKKQIANAVYWTFKKTTPIDEKEQIFDFLILGDLIEEGFEKTEVLAYTAPIKEINELKEIFTKSQLPLTGITTVPFSFQNLLKTGWLKTDTINVCNLYIGQDWSRIDIFAHNHLVLSRGIKAGTQSMIEALQEELDNRLSVNYQQPTDSTVLPVTTLTEPTFSIDTELVKKLFYALIEADMKPFPPKPEIDVRELVGMDFSWNQLFDMIIPALDRIGRQVEKTLEHYALNFGQSRVDKIYISGRVSADRRFVDYIGDQLDLPRETIDPFHPPRPLTVKISRSKYESENSRYTPAVGLALSSNAMTPNLIFTFNDKENLFRINRIHRLVVSASLILLTLCMGFYSWQEIVIKQKKNQIARLQQELDQGASYLDRPFLQLIAAKVQENEKTLKSYSDKYLGLSLITELCAITPVSIQLTGFSIQMDALSPDRKAEKPDKKKNSLKEEKNILNMDGIIKGDLQSLDASLAGYILKLKESGLFTQPKITHQSLQYFNGEKVLQFSVYLEIL
jgi:Tfp pilus assembly PilM family ATPase